MDGGEEEGEFSRSVDISSMVDEAMNKKNRLGVSPEYQLCPPRHRYE
jgi:hypothetical protein